MDSLTSSEPAAECGLTTSSLAMASFAAAAGAFAWGAVSYFSGYEVGYVAWGLGALVGFAMARFGGRGTTSAVVAAVLTVVGIAGGKLIGTRFVVERELSQGFEQTFTRALHRELAGDAADLADLGADPDEDALRQFMIEHRYTGADSPESVPAAELKEFLATTAPDLQELSAKRLSYEAWYAQQTARSRQAFEAEFSIVQANVEELNGIDLLFVILGVSTAFGVVRKASAQGPGAPSQGQPAADEQEYRRAA